MYGLLTDFYELTMAQGFFLSGKADSVAYFDMYFRDIPDSGGYAIMAGVEQLMEYMENLQFSDDDIEYLRSKPMFCEEFLEYLRNFKFTCDVWAVPEGTPIFPNEPIVTIRGNLIEAQLVETMLLITVNFQSLIATKASRIVRAANGRTIMEFGARRAQGTSAALHGARAAFIGGAAGTSCTLAEKEFSIPALGTMGHSWVQSFNGEYEAFSQFAKLYPDNCTLLVDTYNVLKSGVPNAIKVFDDVLKPLGITSGGIRIDSGDISYLSQKARKMLDDAGWSDIKIVASNSLDEYIIRDLLTQGAKVDIFGVGERLITSKSYPVFGGVYKLAAVEEDCKIIPKIKVSENPAKITTPYFKKVYRLFSNENNMAIADVLTTYDEEIDESGEYEIFDPVHTWKRKKIRNFTAKLLQTQIFKNGKPCYESPNIRKIQQYSAAELAKIWDETKRFENPQEYYVDLSQQLWDIKNQLIVNNNKF